MPRIRLPFYYGWIVIAIAFVTMAISVNARSIFSLLFPSLVEEMGWDRATIAAAFSMGFLTSVVSAPLIGLMIDTFGPRRVIPVAALLVTLGLLMTTQVTAPWELYLSYGLLVVSAGTAMSYMGHGAFLYRWFVRRRGLATGTAV